MTHRKRSIHFSHEHGDIVHTSTLTLFNSHPIEECLLHTYAGISKLCKVPARTNAGVRFAVYFSGTGSFVPLWVQILQLQAPDTVLTSHFKEHNIFKPCPITLDFISKCVPTSTRLSWLICLMLHRLHPLFKWWVHVLSTVLNYRMLTISVCVV
jgi:hypothetical protein